MSHGRSDLSRLCGFRNQATEAKGRPLKLRKQKGREYTWRRERGSGGHTAEREREVTLGKEMCEEGTGMLKRECLCAESSFMRVLSVL